MIAGRRRNQKKANGVTTVAYGPYYRGAFIFLQDDKAKRPDPGVLSDSG